ncbi:MAG: MetQ/NlpA family ABC transporter substrate-binding protein [Tissierellia bacterium]|nr:MetQ/NlpA family ABC transporter substrate-binding protein [Tissierellia bacterium]
MKKRIAFILLALILSLSACSGSNDEKEGKKIVKIGVSPVPHEEIAKIAQEKLKEKDIQLEIVTFDDYVEPNLSVKDKQLDLNFFQHLPYMETFNKEQGTKLVSLGPVHIEPIAFYSDKIDSLDKLENKAEILIPNDATNGARALFLLEKNGLIKLKKAVELPTLLDIEENSKEIKFTEVEAAFITSSYKDVAGAVINSNYAINAGLNPLKDGIVIEDSESNYANILAANEDRKDDPILKEVLDAFQSQEVKDFLENEYKGAIVPAF